MNKSIVTAVFHHRLGALGSIRHRFEIYGDYCELCTFEKLVELLLKRVTLNWKNLSGSIPHGTASRLNFWRLEILISFYIKKLVALAWVRFGQTHQFSGTGLSNPSDFLTAVKKTQHWIAHISIIYHLFWKTRPFYEIDMIIGNVWIHIYKRSNYFLFSRWMILNKECKLRNFDFLRRVWLVYLFVVY